MYVVKFYFLIYYYFIGNFYIKFYRGENKGEGGSMFKLYVFETSILNHIYLFKRFLPFSSRGFHFSAYKKILKK